MNEGEGITTPAPFVFHLGDYVSKVKGYVYVGWVVARFWTRAGEVRYVVENEASQGMLHIYNGSQLELIKGTRSCDA